MKIHLIKSSSESNSYALQSLNGKVLLLEAGVKISKVINTTGIYARDIEGCIISHEHGDHAGFAKDYEQIGIDIWCTPETAKKHKLINYSQFVYTKNNTFKITAFDGFHDSLSHKYFLIEVDNQKVLFIIDTPKVDKIFKNINYLLIESNYSIDLMYGKIVGDFMINRIINSHMSLEYAIKYTNMIVNKSDFVPEVYLLHLSDRNSDEKLYIEKFKQQTGLTPIIAPK